MKEKVINFYLRSYDTLGIVERSFTDPTNGILLHDNMVEEYRIYLYSADIYVYDYEYSYYYCVVN